MKCHSPLLCGAAAAKKAQKVPKSKRKTELKSLLTALEEEFGQLTLYVCEYSSSRGATVEPLIKDTLNKGHLCIKDTFQCTNLYSGNALKEDNLSIMDKMICPNVSVI